MVVVVTVTRGVEVLVMRVVSVTVFVSVVVVEKEEVMLQSGGMMVDVVVAVTWVVVVVVETGLAV